MLHAPVLQLDVARMHEIDPRNVENLFGMWTVFSKCANTIPDGKRLENLSWRVWARETLCCPPQPEKTIVPAIDIPRCHKEDVPSLSNSPNSDDSDDDSLTSHRSTFEDSALSKSRGKEQHLTPTTLEKMVVNIQEQKDLERLGPAIEALVMAKMSPQNTKKEEQSPVSDRSANYMTESSCISAATNATTNTAHIESTEEHRNSDTSVSSDGLIRSGSVVHGFSSPVPSLRSRGSSTITKNLPILASTNALRQVPPKKGGMFTLGGSSEDDGSSFEQRMSYNKRALQEPRKSSLSQSLRQGEPPRQKKTTSFREVMEQHTSQVGGSPADDNAIASDDEDDTDDVGDSAIEEDDDEEAWEDEGAEEEKQPVHSIFKRVDSTAHLPSRRSILTVGLTEGERAKGLLNAAQNSKPSPAVRPMDRASSQTGLSIGVSPEDDDGAVMMRSSGNSRPIQIASPTNATSYAMAYSPRTTRRNMLSTELTESLRKNLLWERQQKNTTVNAFLKREARSMANLQRAGQMAAAQPQPHRTLLQRDATRTNNSYNDYFNVANEYHTKGW